MKKQLLSSLIVLSLFTTSLFSQTNLNLGDIAFTGVNFDGTDDYSFVLLKDITTNTTITFTENGWFSAGGFRSGEGTNTWTAGDNLTCGTQVIITGLTSTNNGGFTNGTVTGSALALSGSGDQIFAYQGSMPTAGDESNFLTAYQGNGSWDADAISSNTSAKPSVFTDGTNSISFPVEKDNAAYTNCGAAIGSANIIYNTANWTQDNTNNTPFVLPVCSSFPCPTTCTNPTTPSVTYAPTSTCSDSLVTLTITGTLNDATEWYIYSGSCGGTLEGAITGNTFQVSPNTSTTYYIRGEGGCVTPGMCGTVIVTVTATDDASFSFNNSNYCQSSSDPTPTITGLTGGTFTSSPSGLSINSTTGEIDLSSSTPNIYGVTYTTNGPCTNSSTQFITVNGATVGYDIISACNSYTWIDGNTYTSTNFTATHLLTNSIGCDSIATLNLTIYNPDNVTDNQSSCGPFTWIDGNTYSTNNNTATHTLTNINGCDSIITLNLTINQANTGIDTQSSCGSYTWIDGNTYTTSNNTATHTLTNVNGCDSIVTLNLTINQANTGIDVQSACGSYTWIDGNTYSTNNNTATHTLTNVNGCDSIVTLNLTINQANTGIDVQSACGSYTWIDGNTYTTNNSTATHTLTNINGCDSIVTLNLTFNQSNTGVDVQTACGSYTWIDGNTYTTSNNTATHTLTNVNGCDSIVTLNLTIGGTIYSTDTQVACDSYTWIDGNTYTSNNNTATHTLTSSQGCDSIVTLDLTLNNSTFGTDTQIACSSYTWIDGNTYTTSNNTATHTLMNTAGCDSIVTLDLTINQISTGVDVQSACGSFTWIDGNTYTASNNTATHTLTNINGCDSIITLDLTINQASTGIDVQSACGSFTWIDGNTYTTANNTATHTLTNINGCDSIVTLQLSMTSSETYNNNVTICYGGKITVGSNNYDQSGTYVDVFTSQSGCDSTIITTLTVENFINTYVSRNNNVFTVTQTGATYQWIDCDNGNTPIAGETDQVFTATTIGNYAVIVTVGSCSETSACEELPYITSVNNFESLTNSIYPNPSKNIVNIELAENYKNSSIVILDLTGKIVYKEKVEDQSQLTISTQDLKNGVYFIRLKTNNNSETIRLIKQ